MVKRKYKKGNRIKDISENAKIKAIFEEIIKKKGLAKIGKGKNRRTHRYSIAHDIQRTARAPGRRISKNKKVYYERRFNESDVDKKKRL